MNRKVGTMTNNKKRATKSVASIVFYVVAVIFLCIAAFSIWQGYLTVQSYKMQYTLKIADTINIYFSACAQYFAYAFILYGMGTVLAKLQGLTNTLCPCCEETPVVVEETPVVVEETPIVEETPVEEVKEETIEA